MSSQPLLATAAILALLAVSTARAETISKTLDGTSLSIDVDCVSAVEIQPQADLDNKVVIEASSPDAGDLTGFIFSGGETASVTRDRHVCVSLQIGPLSINHPGITMAIKVPAGMPIDLRNAGSADYVIGAVGGSLHARLAGSGNITVATVTKVDLDISGSSNAQIAQIDGPAAISISGSGDVKIGSAMMPSLKIDVRGSGGVSIDQGQIETLSAAVAGSGDLKIHAVVKDASLATVGSGDIEVAKVTGSLSSNTAGSGSIRAGKT